MPHLLLMPATLPTLLPGWQLFWAYDGSTLQLEGLHVHPPNLVCQFWAIPQDCLQAYWKAQKCLERIYLRESTLVHFQVWSLQAGAGGLAVLGAILLGTHCYHIAGMPCVSPFHQRDVPWLLFHSPWKAVPVHCIHSSSPSCITMVLYVFPWSSLPIKVLVHLLCNGLCVLHFPSGQTPSFFPNIPKAVCMHLFLHPPTFSFIWEMEIMQGVSMLTSIERQAEMR